MGGARAALSLSPCVGQSPRLASSPSFRPSHRRGKHQTRPLRARGCRPASSGRLDWLGGSVLNGWAQAQRQRLGPIYRAHGLRPRFLFDHVSTCGAGATLSARHTSDRCYRRLQRCHFPKSSVAGIREWLCAVDETSPALCRSNGLGFWPITSSLQPVSSPAGGCHRTFVIPSSTESRQALCLLLPVRVAMATFPVPRHRPPGILSALAHV